MRWAFWEPGRDPGDNYLGGGRPLPGRVLNLSHLRALGEVLGQHTGTGSHVVRKLTNGAPTDIELDALQKLLPSELAFEIVSNPAEEGAVAGIETVLEEPPKRARLLFYPGAPTTFHSEGLPDGSDVSFEYSYALHGQARRKIDWLIPAVFLLTLAAILAPLVVLWVQRDLSLALIPVVALLYATVLFVGAPRVREGVQRARRRRRPADIDLRPIEKVREDREQQRQRRQTGLRYALTTGVLVAVATALLRLWIP